MRGGENGLPHLLDGRGKRAGIFTRLVQLPAARDLARLLVVLGRGKSFERRARRIMDKADPRQYQYCRPGQTSFEG